MISFSTFFAFITPDATSTPFAPNCLAILTSSSKCIPAPQSILILFEVLDASCISFGLASLIEVVPPINSGGSTAT